jgi:LCP family protein required for cell wall assembly
LYKLACKILLNKMRYKDLNYKKKYKPVVNNRVKKGMLIKAGIGVVALGILLFGLKLIIAPVVNALAGFLQDSGSSVSYMLGQQKIKEQNGVTNFLLVGVDERAKGLTSLTDTLIIGSFRHADEKMSLISIPRDLWVKVPAFGQVAQHYTKINSVYSIGSEYEYPSGGGIGLLQQVILDHFGVPIDYFAKVNFEGFQKAVDAVEGVDIYVERSFADYEYPRMGYESAAWSERWEVISFEQGWQHMNGETALKYARSRHAFGPEGSDFARAKRQQKVILALKDKILSNETIFNITRLRELYVTFSNEVETNIGLTDISAMYEVAKRVGDFSNITTHVITAGDDEGGLLYTPDPAEFGGAYVLLPKEGWESIKAYIQKNIYEFTAEPSNLSPTISSSP